MKVSATDECTYADETIGWQYGHYLYIVTLSSGLIIFFLDGNQIKLNFIWIQNFLRLVSFL